MKVTESVLLIKPSTYMNDSGIAILQAMDQFSFTKDEIVVIVDDFNITEGMIRLRVKGSAGGHNGLKSIIYHLKTDSFPRLRIGIGIEYFRKDRDFVLSEFSDSAIKKRITDDGVAAMEKIIKIGKDKAMNYLNKKNNNSSKQEA
ncbi:MAG: aminoacyl-tRNA hydrolase [bacterium (Candidatus Stahlbacteria) CG23_combo_of_CG06-09_8_20_14_all_34_7]|nr:MAG: aminoacyl-tRNA hydrolase [bacterium (Candidatus Stahlbacteria) CG23_combo_of_CG06-09_8_20_14_all_34_7]